MSEKINEYVQREQHRVELDRAMHATPIRDQWRQIIVVTLFLAILGGVFVSRTKRFKAALNQLAAAPAMKKKPLLAKAAKIADPDTATMQAEKSWNEENAKKNGTFAGAGALPSTGDSEKDFDQELAADQRARQNLGQSLEKISEGKAGGLKAQEQLKEALQNSSPEATSPIQIPIAASRSPASSEGIPISAPTGPISTQYRELKKIPDSYALERMEFPDFP